MSAAFTITIDGRQIEVQPGESVLAAARKLAIDIPTLCYLEKCGPLNSCQVCPVKSNGKLVPSCGTKVAPGMVIKSETEEVHEARRTALELLFSDHVGMCETVSYWRAGDVRNTASNMSWLSHRACE